MRRDVKRKSLNVQGPIAPVEMPGLDSHLCFALYAASNHMTRLFVPFAEKSAKEPGCLVYTLMEVIGEPGRFLTFERWTDKAALDGHMVTPEIKAIVPKLDPVLAKPFTQLFLAARTGG